MVSAVTEIVGVYHADGGIRGELAYVVGKLLGRAHCSLCDITHSSVRRKAEWDAYVATLGVPVRLLHLNELTPDLAAAVAGSSPVVLGRADDGWERLLDPDELEGMDGSVSVFARALASRLEGGPITPRDAPTMNGPEAGTMPA